MITTTAPSSRPSDAQWSAHLPRICELYYGRRFTLEETQRTIQQETGFYATLRMYKDRIRNMAVHPKKICMQKYQAMSVVADDFQSRGLSTYFVGPSGFQLFKRTPAQITKQLRRPHCLQPITLEEAHAVLRQSSIHAVLEHAVPASHPSALAGSETLENNLSLPPLAEIHDSTHDYSTPGPLNNFSDDDLLRRRPGTQLRTASLPVIPLSTLLAPQDSAQIPVNESGLLFTPAEPRTARNSDMLSLAGINLLPERLSQPKGTCEEKDSYDFIADFDELSVSAATTPATTFNQNSEIARMLPPPSAPHRRRMATECAAPFFLPCFPAASSPDVVGFSKAVAMEKFRYILTTTPENQYVLPLLNWMGTVLVSNGKSEQLKDFVAECCQVLDSCPDYGFPLATPYRYMLAFCNDDERAMALHGSHFAAGTEMLTQLYGPSHPNVLVNEYYRAWHEMSSTASWSSARAILESCLSKSERVMGHNNLMTINCLVVLGRGYAENDLHEQSRSIFQDITERLDTAAEPLQAYRLMVLQRLAIEDEHFGDLQSAELRYREIYEGRLHYLSAFNSETKAAVCSLASLLRRHGRSGEATAIEQHYDQVFDQQCREEARLQPDKVEHQSMPTQQASQPQIPTLPTPGPG